MRTRLLFILLAVAVCSLSGAAAAHAAAGTVSIVKNGTDKRVDYIGTTDPNVVTFAGNAAGASVTIAETGITDPPAIADADNDCFQDGPNAVTCSDPALKEFLAELRGGNDQLTISGGVLWTVFGEGGEDRLVGSDQETEYLYGGDDNDFIDGRDGGPSGPDDDYSTLFGDAGNDVVRGGPQIDSLYGGSGNDDLDAGGGGDNLYGGDDVDVVRGGDGDDYLDPGLGDGQVVEGGAGTDDFECADVGASVFDGGPGHDALWCDGDYLEGGVYLPYGYVIDLGAGTIVRRQDGTSGALVSFEDSYGSGGDDEIIGTDGINDLWGDDGADIIDGRGGHDRLRGERGPDRLLGVDGLIDRVDGSDGADDCSADEVDDTINCEALALTPLPPPPLQPLAPEPQPVVPADQAGPNCTISGARGVFRRRRVDLTVVCDENATLSADATGRLRRVSRGAIASRVGDVTLASKRLTATAGAPTRVRLTVAKRYRAGVRRGAAIRVAVRAIDALGNQSVVTRSVKL